MSALAELVEDVTVLLDKIFYLILGDAEFQAPKGELTGVNVIEDAVIPVHDAMTPLADYIHLH